MSKAYTKAKWGQEQRSFSSTGTFTDRHSVEEEKKLRQLLAKLQPMIMQAIQQRIDISVENFYDTYEGDIRPLIIQYIRYYIDKRLVGSLYTAGAGIDASALGSEVIKVNIGGTPVGLQFGGSNSQELQVNYDQGLELDGSQLEVKCDKAINKGSDGIYVDLHGSFQTTYGASGPGLEINPDTSAGKLRVVPTHFLKTTDD